MGTIATTLEDTTDPLRDVSDTLDDTTKPMAAIYDDMKTIEGQLDKVGEFVQRVAQKLKDLLGHLGRRTKAETVCRVPFLGEGSCR
jgi:hypothetical protein